MGAVKKVRSHLGSERGKLISSSDRQMAIKLITDAVNQGVRQRLACEVIGISRRTLQYGHSVGLEDRRQTVKRTPANKLSEQERKHILDVCNSKEFCSQTPKQIVPTLADKAIYLASESSFYRILRDAGQSHHRGRAASPATIKKPAAYIADGPNQLWSWDITYLTSTLKGVFFYLYRFMDIYSRKIVGWEVYENESSAEALFKTLKYTPAYPSKPFENLDEARQWVLRFVNWYNNCHRHGSIKYVTPVQRHQGDDVTILEQRKRLYEEAKKKHPERWSGETRNWLHESTVRLNPGNEQPPETVMTKVA